MVEALEAIPAMVVERSQGSEEGMAVVVEVEAALGSAGSPWRRRPLEELPAAHSSTLTKELTRGG